MKPGAILRSSDQKDTPGRLSGRSHVQFFPRFSGPADTPGYAILLAPGGKAFGSGEHETTRSCLEILASMPSFDGKKILDLGCGTGILAMAASLMNSKSIIALDNDIDAAVATAKNVRLNSMDDSIRTILGESDCLAGVTFDLILANLYGDILLSLSTTIKRLAARDAVLLFSGIGYEYLYPVRYAYGKAGFRTLHTMILEDYVTLAMSTGTRDSASLTGEIIHKL